MKPTTKLLDFLETAQFQNLLITETTYDDFDPDFDDEGQKFYKYDMEVIFETPVKAQKQNTFEFIGLSITGSSYEPLNLFHLPDVKPSDKVKTEESDEEEEEELCDEEEFDTVNSSIGNEFNIVCHLKNFDNELFHIDSMGITVTKDGHFFTSTTVELKSKIQSIESFQKQFGLQSKLLTFFANEINQEFKTPMNVSKASGRINEESYQFIFDRFEVVFAEPTNIMFKESIIDIKSVNISVMNGAASLSLKMNPDESFYIFENNDNFVLGCQMKFDNVKQVNGSICMLPKHYFMDLNDSFLLYPINLKFCSTFSGVDCSLVSSDISQVKIFTSPNVTITKSKDVFITYEFKNIAVFKIESPGGKIMIQSNNNPGGTSRTEKKRFRSRGDPPLVLGTIMKSLEIEATDLTNGTLNVQNISLGDNFIEIKGKLQYHKLLSSDPWEETRLFQFKFPLFEKDLVEMVYCGMFYYSRMKPNDLRENLSKLHFGEIRFIFN